MALNQVNVSKLKFGEEFTHYGKVNPMLRPLSTLPLK